MQLNKTALRINNEQVPIVKLEGGRLNLRILGFILRLY